MPVGCPDFAHEPTEIERAFRDLAGDVRCQRKLREQKRRGLLVTTVSASERVVPTAPQVESAPSNGKFPSGDWLCDLSTAPQRRRQQAADGTAADGGSQLHHTTPHSGQTNRRDATGRGHVPVCGLQTHKQGHLNLRNCPPTGGENEPAAFPGKDPTRFLSNSADRTLVGCACRQTRRNMAPRPRSYKAALACHLPRSLFNLHENFHNARKGVIGI